MNVKNVKKKDLKKENMVTKIKIIDSYHDESLRGRVFTAEVSTIYCIIHCSVGIDGVQKKTKHVGKVIPDEFYVEV